jgi:AAA15 family ATPase/GTPase
LELNGLSKRESANIKIALEPETLLVSLGAKLKIEKLKAVREWFLNHETVNFGSPIEAYFRSAMLPEGFVTDKNVQDKVVEYLSAFDESIIGFEVESVKTSGEHFDKLYRINTLHRLNNGNGLQSIPLQNESGGTLKMFALYPALKSVFETGSILMVDELNARLHPLLVRNIMISFLNPEINPNHAQLIMTTHDVWQFTNDFLRRDELWVTDKDKEGVSTLYSVADFKDEDGNKVRRKEALARNYLVGNYGGIPALKPICFIEDGDEVGR